MKATLSLLVLALLLGGCQEDSESPDDSASSIAGRIILFDSTGTVLTDFSGVSVTVDGKSSATTTDETGYWELKNLHSGTYDITAGKGWVRDVALLPAAGHQWKAG